MKRISIFLMRIMFLRLFLINTFYFKGLAYLFMVKKCAVARRTMVEWDRQWMELLVKMGATLKEAARYMDDLRAIMYDKKGWMWETGELC